MKNIHSEKSYGHLSVQRSAQTRNQHRQKYEKWNFLWNFWRKLIEMHLNVILCQKISFKLWKQLKISFSLFLPMLVAGLGTSFVTQMAITFFMNHIFSICFRLLLDQYNTFLVIYNTWYKFCSSSHESSLIVADLNLTWTY